MAQWNKTVEGTKLSANASPVSFSGATVTNLLVSSGTLYIPVISGTARTVPNSLVLSGTTLIFVDSGTHAHTLTFSN